MQRHYFLTKCCQLILLTFLANVIPWQGHIRFPFLIKNQIGALLDFIMWRWYFGGRWNDKSMFSFSSVLHWIPTNKHFHTIIVLLKGALITHMGFLFNVALLGFLFRWIIYSVFKINDTKKYKVVQFVIMLRVWKTT